MMFGYDHGMRWSGWAGMGIGMALCWAVLIAGIVVLSYYPTGNRAARQPSPEHELGARFARGDINEVGGNGTSFSCRDRVV
jgi:hypothetical protein